MTQGAGNRLALTGTLVSRDALRFTPAGVPMVSFRVAHESRQVEAGAEREVRVEVACVAVEALARLVANAPLGAVLEMSGFLAFKGKSSRQLALHVSDIEFREKE